MAWASRKDVFLLHTVVLLLYLGQTGSSGTRITTTQDCALPETSTTQRCSVTTYSAEDMLLSNDTVWICTNSSDSSVLDCCPNVFDPLLNVTRGITTKVDCSLVATNSTFEYELRWRIVAPDNSLVLLTVSDHDVRNTIQVFDGDNENAYTFTPNSFGKTRDFFLSSSNAVSVRVNFSSSAETQNLIVTARSLDIIDTVNVTGGNQDCTVSRPATGPNRWDAENDCGDDQHTFGDSCYQFNTNEILLSTAIDNCNRMGYHLVYIESSEEQEFLVANLNPTCPDDVDCGYWIGLEKDANDDQVWMDGSELTYSNFEIINDGGDCFRLKIENYLWADRACDRNLLYGYICEREQGYHGWDPSHGGCISFRGTLPENAINNNHSILLRFSYYIKTYQNKTAVWNGNHVIRCLSNNDQTLSQNGLQLKISCANSAPDLWTVNFHATGMGLVQISEVQLLVLKEPESLTTTPTATSSVAMVTSTQSTLSDPSAVLISVAVVVPTVLLIAVILGAMWFKKRHLPSASKQKPQLQRTDSGITNAAFGNNNGGQQEFTKKRISREGDVPMKSAEGNQQLQSAELRPSASPSENGNVNVYNEVGEEFPVSFGGDDYHEYSLPDIDQGKAKAPSNNGLYQELLSDVQRDHPYQDLLEGNSDLAKTEASNNNGLYEDLLGDGRREHPYQDLREDSGGSIALQNGSGLPTKAVSEVAAPDMENSYQDVVVDGHDYLDLEPELSLNLDNHPENTYLSLE